LGRDGQEIVTHKSLFLQLCWSGRFSHFAFDMTAITLQLPDIGTGTMVMIGATVLTTVTIRIGTKPPAQALDGTE
jgi:hypothetical protein